MILPPYQGGGGMINEVMKDDITYAEVQQNLKQEQCKLLKL